MEEWIMEKREEQLKEITEKLELGVAEVFTSEKYTEYLNTMAKFHNYSFNNTLLIVMQKPESTLVAGYQAWQKKFNRQVKRGEKGIQIIAPAPFKEKHEIEKVDPETGEIILGEDGQPETEVVEQIVPRFRVTTVFDVSQTTGEPIPEFEVPELDGNVLIYDHFMDALQAVAPVPFQFKEIEGDAKGYYNFMDKYIGIQSGMSEAQTMKTAVHETAHAILHDRDQMREDGVVKDRLTREVEAESVAYVICDHFGLDTSSYSFSYIASWTSGKDMKELRNSMDTIRKTSAGIIGQIEKKMQELEHSLPNREEPITEEVEVMPVLSDEVKKKIKEIVLLQGEGNHYGIYQLNREGKDSGYQFLGLETARNMGFVIAGKDYQMVYSEPIQEATTLDALYEKFNINHPEDFTGHSLSVSDVIVRNWDGTVRAYYVDSFGFSELPDFVAERSELMKEKTVKNHPDVYKGTLEHAMEEKNVDAYLDSRKMNIDCKNAIEHTIAENFDGKHLSHDAALGVVEEYGEERVSFVLANTLKQLSHDGRFSDRNKQWAEGIEVPENVSRGMDLNKDYVVGSHPAVLDGFIDLAREEIRTRKLGQMLGVKSIRITKDTKEYEADGHTGTWYAIDEKKFHGEMFFQMRNESYGHEVADIIVSENGTLVAEDIWHGFDKGVIEAISEYLEGNGATVYDLKEFPEDTIVTLQSGKVLTIQSSQDVEQDTWAEAMVGMDEAGNETWFHFYATSMVKLPDGIKLKMPDSHYIDQYYVIEDLQTRGSLRIQRYDNLGEALGAYYALPNHKMKTLGIENTAPLKGSLDFIQCKNGVDTFIRDCQKSESWLNPEIYQVVTAIQDSLDTHDTQIAYQIEDGYFTIQTVSDGYDYTFYDENFMEKDGGVYDDPMISIEEAIEELLEEEGLSQRDAIVMDYEELEIKIERAESEHMMQSQQEIPYCTSEQGKCEAALNGMSRAEVEYDVLAHTRAVLEEMGLENDVLLIGARVYGSRSREGLYQEGSDLDVVVSYKGDIKEDILFNAVNEAGLKIAGVPVDINPISEEQTGTLEEYMEKAEQYLNEKASISFFTAECMEFPVLGEYHDNLTLEEALTLYEKIPADRKNGIKGIGFVLQDGSDYDGPYDLMRMGKVDREGIELIQHYKDSPLVQKAMQEVETYFADKRDVAQKVEQAVEVKTVPKEQTNQSKSKKESVLQALRERQAKKKEQEQSVVRESSKSHKRGEMSL